MSESLADHFAEQAGRQPDAPALIWDGRAISYGELQEMADQAHAELEGLGLPADRPVGIEAKKSPEAIVLILACLRARRPFLLPSIELAPETLAKLFGQAGASRVLSPAEESGDALSAGEVPAEEDIPDTEWPPPGGGDDIAFMLTTSGSTGLPKIVPLAEGAIDHFTDWAAAQFGIGPGTKVLNYAPLNFDLCLLDIWSTLKAGACVVLVDQAKATHGGYLVDLLADNEVDVVQAVPMLYRLLIDATRESGGPFPSVKHVITTGDKIPATSLAQLPELFPNARVFNVYGCTETNDSMMHEFDRQGLSPAGGLSPTQGDCPLSRRRCRSASPFQASTRASRARTGGRSRGPAPASCWCGRRSRRAAISTSRGTRVRSSRAATTDRVSRPTTGQATSFAATRTASSPSRAAATST